ncbi:MAG: hypothetical protein AAGA60_15380 [Cyanobacteria bacterium P01_E01_bin.42]
MLDISVGKMAIACDRQGTLVEPNEPDWTIWQYSSVSFGDFQYLGSLCYFIIASKVAIKIQYSEDWLFILIHLTLKLCFVAYSILILRSL